MDGSDYLELLFFLLWAAYLVFGRVFRAVRRGKEQPPKEDVQEQEPADLFETALVPEDEVSLEPIVPGPVPPPLPEATGLPSTPPPLEPATEPRHVWEKPVPPPLPIKRPPKPGPRRKRGLVIVTAPTAGMLRDALVLQALLERRGSRRPRRTKPYC